MTQTMYAHVNKSVIKEKKIVRISAYDFEAVYNK
jgi:hypothetical protein